LRLGHSNGLLTAFIDAARTRIHMMHELFFAIARDLPWDIRCNGTWKNCSGRTPIPGRSPAT
jgi:hypothetical protein